MMKSGIKSICIAAGIAELILFGITAAALVTKFCKSKQNHVDSPCDNTGESEDEIFFQDTFD